MLGFNGGLLGKRRRPSLSAAPGVWFANEQVIEKRETTWPLSGGYRYWRFANFASTSLNSNVIDLTEVEFYVSNTKITGITATANFSWTSGTTSVIVDGTKSDGNRAYRDGWSSIQSTATLTFDFGAAILFDQLQIFSLYTQLRFPESFSLDFSIDGTTYYTYKTITVGASFTSLGSNVFTSGLVTI
ncbi:MAG: hypothetical protein ACO218_10755 [Steroidobacteraceae bacterium]